jgi:uncharacterized FlgJ-related protein
MMLEKANEKGKITPEELIRMKEVIEKSKEKENENQNQMI